MCWFDDIIVINRKFKEHLELLTEVFRRLREARLRFNPNKCRFCVDQLRYLDHVIDRNGVHIDFAKISDGRLTILTTFWKLRQFLRHRGTAVLLKIFFCVPVSHTIDQEGSTRSWETTVDKIFQHLKQTLIAAPVLFCSDFTRKFILQIDTSQEDLGAVLTQFRRRGMDNRLRQLDSKWRRKEL